MLVTLLGIVTLVRLIAKGEGRVSKVGDAIGDRDVGQAVKLENALSQCR